MSEENQRKRKHFVIPDGAVFLGIIIVLAVFVFGFHKNWFPMSEKVDDVPVGIYELVGTNSQIIVSENHTIQIVNFDLNGAMGEKYHGYDLNAVYLGREVGFELQEYHGAVYKMCLDEDESVFLEVLYRPREDVVVILYPDIDLEYAFEYSGN